MPRSDAKACARTSHQLLQPAAQFGDALVSGLHLDGGRGRTVAVDPGDLVLVPFGDRGRAGRALLFEHGEMADMLTVRECPALRGHVGDGTPRRRRAPRSRSRPRCAAPSGTSRRTIMAVDVPNRQVAEAFVELADTAGGDFDLPTYADLVSSHSVELLRAEAAGVLVGDSSDATAPEQLSPVLDSRALQMHEGAGFECFATGLPVRCHDLGTAHHRWPGYAPAARDAGFGSVYAFPMQRRARGVGALEVLVAGTAGLDDDDVALGQALADMAATGILNERRSRSSGALINQLQTALDSRVAIEQAKGVLAARHEIDINEAFTALRQYARSHNLRLLDVARTVVTSPALSVEVLTARRQR